MSRKKESGQLHGGFKSRIMRLREDVEMIKRATSRVDPVENTTTARSSFQLNFSLLSIFGSVAIWPWTLSDQPSGHFSPFSSSNDSAVDMQDAYNFVDIDHWHKYGSRCHSCHLTGHLPTLNRSRPVATERLRKCTRASPLRMGD